MKQKENWKEFCKRIIATNGKPSTKDAEECGISFEQWLMMATNRTAAGLVKGAKTVLEKMEDN